jgi:hypothetical protein
VVEAFGKRRLRRRLCRRLKPARHREGGARAGLVALLEAVGGAASGALQRRDSGLCACAGDVARPEATADAPD